MAASDSPTTVQQSQQGCLFFDFALPHVFNFDQKFSRNVAQRIIYYHVTKQLLPCLNWLVTCFQFQNMFWKNISCFDFDEKLTKSVAKVTIYYHVSKDFLPLHIAVGQLLSISTENGRMSCKQKYALKTWRWKSQFWFGSTFVYFADLKTIYFASCLCCKSKLF